MSFIGKLGLLLSALSLIILTSTVWILGGWIPILYGFLVLFFIGIITSLIIDRNLYLGFLFMKTTKNGISIGSSILIALVFCVSLAYLSKRFEKSIDITEEKINSLAPQTMKLLNNLETDIKFIVFYQGGIGYRKKDLIKNNLQLFKLKNNKVKSFYYDIYIENKLAQKYLNDISNKSKKDIFVFVEYKGNKVLVEAPFNEEKLTTSIIQVTRREKHTIYFLSGHGEKDLLNHSGSGISLLDTALKGSSFKVKSWNFITDGKLPKNISALVIAGPQRLFLKKEINWLEQYLKSGGKLLLALDPDAKTNLKPLLKKFSVKYKQHFIKDSMAKLIGLGVFSVIGIYFDTQHIVTRSVSRGSIFLTHLTSDLEVIKNDVFVTTSLIKTDSRAESKKNISTEPQNKGVKASHTIALLVENKKSMMLAVFGDSDFLSNNFINKGVNRDIALNIISYLAAETDLVSIRPKKLKTTQLVLKQSHKIVIILFSIALPIISFICCLIIWFRRREA